MKKTISILIIGIMIFSLTSCGKQSSTGAPSTGIINNEEKVHDDTVAKSSTINIKASTLDELNEIILNDAENTIASLTSEYEKITTDINTYEKYKENYEKVEAFYYNVCSTQQALNIRLREYSCKYAELIISSKDKNSVKYENLEGIYENIYDDVGKDIYDDIYDGFLKDIYDDFYDGIIKDAYDTVSYDEWYDVHSDEYDIWYDTRSDIYDDWYDMRSDIYDFQYDLRSEMWDGDVERAKEKIADFKEDIIKLKEKTTN